MNNKQSQTVPQYSKDALLCLETLSFYLFTGRLDLKCLETIKIEYLHFCCASYLGSSLKAELNNQLKNIIDPKAQLIN